MDFDQAIVAHSAWKLKLAAYIRKPDGSLNSVDVGADNKCALGQWIYGEGSKYSSFPEFSVLKSEHARFHMAAADIIKKADSGQQVSEDFALGSKSAFADASGRVVTAIMKMKRNAKAA
jgi:methyl-accepting chemotaxis protein